MGIQSYGDNGEGFAALLPAPHPLLMRLLLRNPIRAQENAVHAQKEIGFHGVA
jgi:hypothetical protein